MQHGELYTCTGGGSGVPPLRPSPSTLIHQTRSSKYLSRLNVSRLNLSRPNVSRLKCEPAQVYVSRLSSWDLNHGTIIPASRDGKIYPSLTHHSYSYGIWSRQNPCPSAFVGRPFDSAAFVGFIMIHHETPTRYNKYCCIRLPHHISTTPPSDVSDARVSHLHSSHGRSHSLVRCCHARIRARALRASTQPQPSALSRSARPLTACVCVPPQVVAARAQRRMDYDTTNKLVDESDSEDEQPNAVASSVRSGDERSSHPRGRLECTHGGQPRR